MAQLNFYFNLSNGFKQDYNSVGTVHVFASNEMLQIEEQIGIVVDVGSTG